MEFIDHREKLVAKLRQLGDPIWHDGLTKFTRWAIDFDTDQYGKPLSPRTLYKCSCGEYHVLDCQFRDVSVPYNHDDDDKFSYHYIRLEDIAENEYVPLEPRSYEPKTPVDGFERVLSYQVVKKETKSHAFWHKTGLFRPKFYVLEECQNAIVSFVDLSGSRKSPEKTVGWFCELELLLDYKNSFKHPHPDYLYPNGLTHGLKSYADKGFQKRRRSDVDDDEFGFGSIGFD